MNKRTIIAIIEVDDDRAIEKDEGTLDYINREFLKLQQSGISLEDARILDDDDPCGQNALNLVDMIFSEEV